MPNEVKRLKFPTAENVIPSNSFGVDLNMKHRVGHFSHFTPLDAPLSYDKNTSKYKVSALVRSLIIGCNDTTDIGRRCLRHALHATATVRFVEGVVSITTTQFGQSHQGQHIFPELQVYRRVDQGVGYDVDGREVEGEGSPPRGQGHSQVTEAGYEVGEVGEDEGQADQGDGFDRARGKVALFLGFGQLDAAAEGDLGVDFGGGFVDGDEDEDVGGGDDEHWEEVQTDVQQGDEGNLE